MSEVKFISDTHLGHKNITKFRFGFDSAEEHDKFVFESIMDNISKRDTLWILGDICFTMESFVQYFVPITKKAKKVKIILGNHDLEQPKAPTILDYLNCGVSIHSLVKYKNYWLSHAPMHQDELRGKLNIHGHTHSSFIQDNRYFNVCCENVNYIPVTLDNLPITKIDNLTHPFDKMEPLGEPFSKVLNDNLWDLYQE